MKVDLYTDASVRLGVVTWAAVLIIGTRDPVEAFGTMREETNQSGAAELRAIANALHRMIARGEIERGATVTIRTDNREAVDRIEGTARTGRKRDQPANAAAIVISKLAETHGLKIVARHVKGHQPLHSTDPHAVHNRRCDALCREARKVKPIPTPRPNKAKRALATARALQGAA